MEVGLSIGANLGDRIANLDAIHFEIAALSDLSIIAESFIYETDPVGVPAEFAAIAFLNTVIIVESNSNPSELVVRFQAIEEQLGRTPATERNTPRPVDIDIIYAGALQLDTHELTIPHPRWHDRRFVVQPLADVRPALVLPGETRTVHEILLSLPETPKVLRYADK